MGTFGANSIGESQSPATHFRRFLVRSIFSFNLSLDFSKFASIANVL